MGGHTTVGRKWRRFCRKHGVTVALVLLASIAALMVALMTCMISSTNYRWRW